MWFYLQCQIDGPAPQTHTRPARASSRESSRGATQTSRLSASCLSASRAASPSEPDLLGLRGVGKTVLLLEFETLAREAGWVCNDVEEVGSGDFRQTFAELAYQMLLSMSRRKRMQARATAALGVLKAFSLGLPGGITAKIDVEAASGTADTGDPERDLATCSSRSGRWRKAAARAPCSSSMRCRRSTRRRSRRCAWR